MSAHQYWKPAPFPSSDEGHLREFLYVDHRYWGEIEQFNASGPCYATVRGERLGAMLDIDSARHAVETRVLTVVREPPSPPSDDRTNGR